MRLQINGRVTFCIRLCFTLCCPLRIGVEAPRSTFQRDAVPSVTLFYGRHARPVLHFFKSAATAFAHSVALTGGANGDAGRVGRGMVPSQPSSHGFGWEAVCSGGVLVVKDHQGINLGQCPQLRAQGDTIGRRAALAPVVDGGFYVGDVQGGVHGEITAK